MPFAQLVSSTDHIIRAQATRSLVTSFEQPEISGSDGQCRINVGWARYGAIGENFI